MAVRESVAGGNSDEVIWALAYGRSNDPKDWDWSKAGLDVQFQNAVRRLKELFDDGAAKVNTAMTGLHGLAGERSPKGRLMNVPEAAGMRSEYRTKPSLMSTR